MRNSPDNRKAQASLIFAGVKAAVAFQKAIFLPYSVIAHETRAELEHNQLFVLILCK
jgi:hypothetical protein